MRSLLLLLLLLPSAAEAAAPELLCEPDVSVNFEQRWLRGSRVLLGDHEYPWTGHETRVSGAELRNLADSSPDGSAELSGLPETTSFVAFASASGSLLVEQDLLQGSESDGLVIERSAGLRVLHCRSR